MSIKDLLAKAISDIPIGSWWVDWREALDDALGKEKGDPRLLMELSEQLKEVEQSIEDGDYEAAAEESYIFTKLVFQKKSKLVSSESGSQRGRVIPLEDYPEVRQQVTDTMEKENVRLMEACVYVSDDRYETEEHAGCVYRAYHGKN